MMLLRFCTWKGKKWKKKSKLQSNKKVLCYSTDGSYHLQLEQIFMYTHSTIDPVSPTDSYFWECEWGAQKMWWFYHFEKWWVTETKHGKIMGTIRNLFDPSWWWHECLCTLKWKLRLIWGLDGNEVTWFYLVSHRTISKAPSRLLLYGNP